MNASPHDGPVVELATFVRSERSAILAAWKYRVSTVPPSNGASLTARGVHVLAWLASALESDARGDGSSAGLPQGESFSAPRTVAELTLLIETITQLQPASIDLDLARETLHRVLDSAIAQSVARDVDENERLGKRLRLATEVTLVGSWDLDPITGVVGADPRARELFGVAGDAPTTLEALTEHLHELDRDRVRDGIGEALASGRPYVDDCRTLRAQGGTRWITIAADGHRGRGSHSPRVLGIVHDITQRKESEEEHARVVEELSRAVHVSEMFVGILSHDLRTPLGAMLTGAHLLKKEQPRELAARVLSRVVSSGERMGRMIDQLLDFTRTRLGEGIPLSHEAVDLAALARDALEDGKGASPASVLRITQHGDTTGCWDRDRVCQVLSNLVGNAIQHGEPSGAIEVVVDGRHPGRVVLTVENQGAIPAHLLPILFNPFRGTVEKRGRSQGLGLGLYVARQIAIAHGGDLEARSTGSATAFELTLPRVPPATTALPRQDVARDEELAAFERMAAPPSSSSITGQLFGATPLHERAPEEIASIATRYAKMLEIALQRKAFRGEGAELGSDLRVLAERLGELGAGPREVTDIHARALREAVRGVTTARSQALLSEGRLVALELMGHLASYYRRRSRGAPSRVGGTRRNGT